MWHWLNDHYRRTLSLTAYTTQNNSPAVSLFEHSPCTCTSPCTPCDSLWMKEGLEESGDGKKSAQGTAPSLTIQFLMEMAFSEMLFTLFSKLELRNYSIDIIVVFNNVIYYIHSLKLCKLEQKTSLWCQSCNRRHGVSTKAPKSVHSWPGNNSRMPIYLRDGVRVL